jgi:hypothetical protein
VRRNEGSKRALRGGQSRRVRATAAGAAAVSLLSTAAALLAAAAGSSGAAEQLPLRAHVRLRSAYVLSARRKVWGHVGVRVLQCVIVLPFAQAGEARAWNSFTHSSSCVAS